MAATDMNAQMHIKDGNGNVNNIFPATKIGNVEGLQSALDAKANSSDVTSGLAGKVDKETGKGLSTNDYTTAEKNKLAGIEAQANKTVVDDALSSTSTNPVQNKVINTALAGKADASALEQKADADDVDTLTTRVSGLSTRLNIAEDDIAAQTARIDNIVALPEGSTTGDAELMDIRVKADGTTASSAGNAVREQISVVTNDLDQIESSMGYDENEFSQGLYDTTSGAESTHHSEKYIRTAIVPITKNLKKIVCAAENKIIAYCYNATSYLGWWNGSTFVIGEGSLSSYSNEIDVEAIKNANATYFAVVVKKSSGADITSSDYTNVHQIIDIIEMQSNHENDVEKLNDSVEVYADTNRICVSVGSIGEAGNDYDRDYEIRTSYINVKKDDRIEIESGYEYRVYYYDNSYNILSRDDFTSRVTKFNSAKKIRLLVRKIDSVVPVDVSLFSKIKLKFKGNNSGVRTDINNLMSSVGDIKVDLSTANLGGYLYNGTFYSANTYKTIDVNIANAYSVDLVGMTENNFCLYHMIDKNGNIIKSAPEDQNPKFDDITVIVPDNAITLRYTARITGEMVITLHKYSEKELEILKRTSAVNDDNSIVVNAQRSVAKDWRFPFINTTETGCGSNHVIPGTAKIWVQSGTTDLTQNQIAMKDGLHPSQGNGIVKMMARTIANQISIVSPDYYNDTATQVGDYWNGKNFLWLGTSIPAGSDPALDVHGSSYPSVVASQLNATVTNNARGSSCIRLNASTGEYTNMAYHHFIRSLSRTVAECGIIANNWANIYTKIVNAPSTLSPEDLAIMKQHSFENLLLPYLDGTNAMPDCFVLDHGTNDKRPLGINGEPDIELSANLNNVNSGVLAEDSYMTANNYAQLKFAFNDSLSGISNLSAFSASVNRNCFKGAMNFIITLILRYNPHARIIIISHYN